MTLDLFGASEITACAALVIMTYTTLFGRTLRERIVIASGFVLWFVLVESAAATGALGNYGLGTAGLGITFLLPLLGLTSLAYSPIGRARIESAPFLPVVAIQATRVLGVTFVLLYAAHRLPAPFAPVAGWGDIIAGVAALPLAWWLSRDPRGARGAFLAVSIFGILDLVAAISLGATSAPGPIRLFFDGGSGTAIMSTFPWMGIPCFLVPSLLFMEFIGLSKARHTDAAVPDQLSKGRSPMGRSSSSHGMERPV
ncbi:MAG TPA: hypothetical protein VNF68_01985 [Candidatus Baltobacteraceae bacterium]|nr:hypothetical protein [Candidatus Baltobacteraceae bacterium]